MNLQIAKDNFVKYTNTFDKNNPNILRKIQHSFRVMDISKQVAKSLNLDEEQIELATLIGLLHDIGRFEQYRKFKTFDDLQSMDHAELGIKVLEQDDIIREFIKDNKYDNIIKKAIHNHNKYSIEEGLSEDKLLFSKIIRDSDKVDILYETEEIFFKGKEEEVNNSVLDEFIYKELKSKKTILITKDYIAKGINDVFFKLALVYDINFKESFRLIEEKNYINNVINKFDIKDKNTKEKTKEIISEINNFIEEKIK